MKTTNFEISKKLAEIGFKPNDEESKIWNYEGQVKWEYPAYDLETLIDALPKNIGSNQQLRIWFGEDTFIGYQNWNGFVPELTIKQKENESLADTAGRLLIKLHETGIINFKK